MAVVMGQSVPNRIAEFSVAVDGLDHAEDIVRGPDGLLYAGGVVETYSTGTGEHPLSTPNGLAFASDGTLYVTDSGSPGGNDGLIYTVTPDRATAVFSDAVPGYPNGVVIS